MRVIRLVGKAKYGGSWDGTKLPEERLHEGRGNLKDNERGLPKDSSELMNDQRNEIGREEARWETQLAWWGVLRENRTGQSRGFFFSNEENFEIFPLGGGGVDPSLEALEQKRGRLPAF